MKPFTAFHPSCPTLLHFGSHAEPAAGRFSIPQPHPNRRSLLRDLHTFGIVSVFRRPSIFRIWEPLREPVRSPEE